MASIIPKILILDDDFRDTAKILYSHIVKSSEEMERWDINNLIHLLQLMWNDQIQVINFQAAIISKGKLEYCQEIHSECAIVSQPKDQNGIGNFRISPIKVACCLFRWPKLTEIRRITSVSWCKCKLNNGTNQMCINPYHYQAKLAHYDFQYVGNDKIEINRNFKDIGDNFIPNGHLSTNHVSKIKFLKNKIIKNIRENNVLLSALNKLSSQSDVLNANSLENNSISKSTSNNIKISNESDNNNILSQFYLCEYFDEVKELKTVPNRFAVYNEGNVGGNINDCSASNIKNMISSNSYEIPYIQTINTQNEYQQPIIKQINTIPNGISDVFMRNLPAIYYSRNQL